ncbi:MAG: gliding motility-associated C-terminal domain-containing protein [Bacteroidota bacterium]
MSLHHRNIRNLLFPLLTCFGLLLFSQLATSQIPIDWNRTYGSIGWEELNAMALTPDGGYLFAGVTTGIDQFYEVTQPSRGDVDYWMIKVDSAGVPIWDKRFGGVAKDRAWTVAATPDGGYIIGGESDSWVSPDGDRTEFLRGYYDFWALKLDANGNIEWQNAYGGTTNDILRTIIPLSDGYLMAGYSQSDTAFEKSEIPRGSYDFWVVRTDLTGKKLWDKTIGGAGDDQLFDAELAPDGNFILGGFSASGIGFDKTSVCYGLNDFWILKLEDKPDPKILWQQNFGGNWEEAIQDIFPLGNDNYLLMGQSSSEQVGNKTAPLHGSWDAYLVKVRDDGDICTKIWDKSYGGTASDIAYSAAQSNTGKLLVVGGSWSEARDTTGEGNKEDTLIGLNDYWLIYLDQEGEKIWDMDVGGKNLEFATKIMRAHKRGFIIGGHSASGESLPYKDDFARGVNDMYVLKTGCYLEGASLASPTPVCPGETVQVDATLAGCEHCLYTWDDGNKEATRIFSPDSTARFHVTIVDNESGCDLRDSVQVTIAPVPESMLADVRDISCYGKTDGRFVLGEIIGGTPPYLYSFNDGEFQETAHFANLPPGNYDLTVLDAYGCSFDTSFSIQQPEQVLLELGDDIFLDLGDSIQLQALTNLQDSFTIEWLFQPAFLSCLDCMEPWAKPGYTTALTARLVDKNGCYAIDYLHILIEKSDEVFVPNTFSPNLDNINDFFTVYAGASVRQVNRLLIFDRWGEKMFERQNFPPNVDQLGWDGNLDGRPMKPAVFAYFAEIEYDDGRIALFEGSFTLMR